MQARWTLITHMWEKEHQWLYGIAGLLSGFVLGLASSGVLAGWFVWFAEGFWNEALGIAITVIVIDRLYRNRDRENLKRQLIRNAKSNIRDLAVHAIDELRVEGWLLGENGLLQRQDLFGANLEKAQLRDANLQGASLSHANLQGADLVQANLQDAHLGLANLQGAYINRANLQRADLKIANLQEAWLFKANLQDASFVGVDLQFASLWEADLRGANLRNANLENSFLLDAIYDETTVLPDADVFAHDKGEALRDRTGEPIGTEFWTPETDMSRYTNPNHPDFWQPERAREGRE